MSGRESSEATESLSSSSNAHAPSPSESDLAALAWPSDLFCSFFGFALLGVGFLGFLALVTKMAFLAAIPAFHILSRLLAFIQCNTKCLVFFPFLAFTTKLASCILGSLAIRFFHKK